MDSGVSDECSCCKTISRTVPASSGRSFFDATNLSLTKLTVTVPPATLNRKAPSEFSLIGLPRILTTWSRRDLKGSIPCQDAALRFVVATVQTTIAARRGHGTSPQVLRFMARMLFPRLRFCKGVNTFCGLFEI